jgi:hypothetical protein
MTYISKDLMGKVLKCIEKYESLSGTVTTRQREMQENKIIIITPLLALRTHPTTNIGGDVGKRTLLHCWWEYKLVQPLWKTEWRLLKKLNINLPYDPAIPLLGIYPKECNSGYYKGTCTPMFIAALFTIAKLWKQPRCPTTDEWIKEMWYLYTMDLYSATKNEILSFASKWMELENIILTLISQLRRPKIICSPLYADFRPKQLQ